MTSRDRPKVLVVGAGLVGVNIALSLVARGYRVTTCEARAGPVEGSSGRGGSSLGLIDKQIGPMRSLATRSLELLKVRQEAFGGRWLHLTGGLVPVRFGEEELAQELLRDSDGFAHWLDNDETALVTSVLDLTKVSGSLYIEGEGRIDVGAYANAAIVWLRASGQWDWITGTVLTIEESASSVCVELADRGGHLSADAAVLATGYDEYGLAAGVSTACRVVPCRGVILAYPAPWATGRDPIMLGLPYVAGRYHGHGTVGAATAAEVSFSLEIPPGVIRVGSSREYVGLGETGSEDIASRIARLAATYMTTRGVPTPFVCWRPVLASGMPVIGKLPGRSYTFCAMGFEGHGVCVSAAVGEALVDCIDGHEMSSNAEAFRTSASADSDNSRNT